MNDPQRAIALCDENRVRIGEGNAPRVEQSGRDGDDTNLAALHVEDLWTRVARRCLCWLRLLRVAERWTEDQDRGYPANRRQFHRGALWHQRCRLLLRLSGMSLPHDLRQAVRLIHKAPWFTAASVCVLGLGIGATKA